MEEFFEAGYVNRFTKSGKWWRRDGRYIVWRKGGCPGNRRLVVYTNFDVRGPHLDERECVTPHYWMMEVE